MSDGNKQASHVAQTIRAFLAGSGGTWDWDDFTSCPIGDARLDSIRLRANAVPLPADIAGRHALQLLAMEAEKLADG